MADLIELEARISAMELLMVTHILQAGISVPGFDARAFASSRRDAWTAIGRATCESCSSEVDEKRFAQAYADALERVGHLMVALAEPVQEAIDEVTGATPAGGRNPAEASQS